MDNQMMLNMLTNMLDKMSDKELEKTLAQAKAFLGPQDYEKLKTIINEKKHNN